MTNTTAFSITSSPRDTPRVVVIGAGVGGLVAALTLVGRGLDVTVVERAETPGGKVRQLCVDGAWIDAGPTVFTMRDVFEEIFAEAGTSLDAHLRLEPLDVLARHAWGPEGVLDLFADVERSVASIGAFFGAEEGHRYRDFCARAAQVFRMLEDPFIRSPSPSIGRLVRRLAPRGELFSISPFTTLWKALGTQFRDPRLRQLFGRYATYCGSSPFLCPATLMLVAHVEQQGVWLVDGGMHRLAIVLSGLAQGRGARFRYGAEVRAIRVEGSRAAGVELAGGERIEADAVICNADVAALTSGLFGEAVRGAASATRPRQRSLSALTCAVMAKTADFPLLRHTVFFSQDYAAEFDDILARGRVPRRPTVYVCAQDRDAQGRLPQGSRAERLLTIVNAPPTGDTQSLGASEIVQCEENMIRTLSRCGLTIERRPGCRHTTTPEDFARLFPATGGALYGAASHGWMASFRRPGVRSRIKGLYLCGGSSHPGPGIPMAALSGRMAAASLVEDWASTRRSSRAAMPGGMSTG